jgi:hypothetical protein
MELLGDRGYVDSHIGLFGGGVSVSVRCTICGELTIG